MVEFFTWVWKPWMWSLAAPRGQLVAKDETLCRIDPSTRHSRARDNHTQIGRKKWASRYILCYTTRGREFLRTRSQCTREWECGDEVPVFSWGRVWWRGPSVLLSESVVTGSQCTREWECGDEVKVYSWVRVWWRGRSVLVSESVVGRKLNSETSKTSLTILSSWEKKIHKSLSELLLLKQTAVIQVEKKWIALQKFKAHTRPPAQVSWKPRSAWQIQARHREYLSDSNHWTNWMSDISTPHTPMCEWVMKVARKCSFLL